METSPNFEQSPVLCAEQVEIFVPKNEAFIGKLRLFFDHLILLDKIPISDDHKFWLQRLAENYRASTKKTLSFDNKNFWENLIFGYSIYEADGRFIGTDKQLQRRISCYFEEPTLIIKLILTNYHTRGLNYPLIQSFPDPFQKNTQQLFIYHAISSYRDDDADIALEYATMMLHYLGISSYIFNQLSHEIMHDEQEIWLQRWPTQLSRRFKAGSRDVPIVNTPDEKRLKFGVDVEKTLCVIDYVRSAEAQL